MKMIISGISVLLMIFSSLWGMAQNQIAIIAHRGASYDAPENTLAAVNLAWQRNADAVEVDVHLSKDNRVMVIHDKTTGRTAGEDLIVKESGSELLRQLEVGSWKDTSYQGEKIPLIEEVLQTVPENKKLFIEIKSGPETVPVLQKILDQHPKKENVVIISFHYQVIAAMTEYLPEVPRYWLLGGPNLKNWDKIIDQTNQSDATGLNLYHGLITAKSSQKISQANLPLYCWTVDDPQLAAKMISLGVKGITTNRPQYLMGKLNLD
ncbi:MAG: glycerophosphodiester phosphodiesterase [Candidatus Cyclobacteriaceae bacterium M3_2C_046]